jgi:L-seryl-tRNA(Ser) seleniumtransferase
VHDDRRRRLPSVDSVLQREEVLSLIQELGRPLVVRELRRLLQARRAAASPHEPEHELVDALRRAARAAAAPSLLPVINATGVVIHTNLGRAPLSGAAAERVARIARGYSNLEYDLGSGKRGDREVHALGRLVSLLAAEAALVVNNNAAAVMLAVNSFAEGKEALVSRGELVEIGGSFRIPDVIKKGGARLVEVGTTNRTRLRDYERALSPATGLILKVHPSNFRIVGFTEETPLAELVALARKRRVPLVEDLGSGLLGALAALPREPLAAARLAAGVDVVTMSGDKLAGGPQAGLVAGRRKLLERMRKNPLYRALRVDKMTLAALEVVLADHESGRAHERVPTLRMLAATLEQLRERAAGLAQALPSLGVSLEVVAGESAVGGGAAPGLGLPTQLLAIRQAGRTADELAASLRRAPTPVIARVADGRLLLDLRSVLPEDEPALRAALLSALGG